MKEFIQVPWWKRRLITIWFLFALSWWDRGSIRPPFLNRERICCNTIQVKSRESFIKDLLLPTNLLLLNGGEGAPALTQSNLVNCSPPPISSGVLHCHHFMESNRWYISISQSSTTEKKDVILFVRFLGAKFWCSTIARHQTREFVYSCIDLLSGQRSTPSLVYD